MRDRYGSTAVQALRTALPFREQAPPKKKRQLVLTVSREKATGQLAVFRQKHQVALARLLEALIETPVLPMELVTGSLKVTPSVWRPMEEMGLLTCETEQIYRMPAVLKELQSQMQQPSDPNESEQNTLHLNPSQQYAVDTICTNWEKQAGRYLLFGVTGSGKTAVYMELIAHALSRGEQAILLIPEISLTYQNVIRFYHRFGDRISILHSRLSQA